MKLSEMVIQLSSVDDETLDKIAQYEKEGRFNEHLEGSLAPYTPVGADYNYLPKTTLKGLLQKQFIVKPFCRCANKLFKTEVIGSENLARVKGAIVCCNHVNKLDCVAVQYACRPRKTYMTAAEFNNMEGFLGDMMRLGGMMPMSTSFSAQKNFDAAISKILDDGNFVTFFPERAEWWGYEKPRPLLPGAYHYAVKFGVPIIPIFITFRETAASRADRKGLKQFVINIAPPIYADEKLSDAEKRKYLQDKNAEAWQKIYDGFYGK